MRSYVAIYWKLTLIGVPVAEDVKNCDNNVFTVFLSFSGCIGMSFKISDWELSSLLGCVIAAVLSECDLVWPVTTSVAICSSITTLKS